MKDEAGIVKAGENSTIIGPAGPPIPSDSGEDSCYPYPTDPDGEESGT